MVCIITVINKEKPGLNLCSPSLTAELPSMEMEVCWLSLILEEQFMYSLQSKYQFFHNLFFLFLWGFQ